MHINPDNFLETPKGRVVTSARNKVAWHQCYEALENALATSPNERPVFLLVGAQGAGKTTYAKHLISRNPNAIVFDAILVKREERVRILQAIEKHNAKAIAVVFETPLSECIARNATRPLDQIVPEQAIRNVHSAMELPTKEEGFHEVFLATEIGCPNYDQ